MTSALRTIATPYVAKPPSGVCIRDRIRDLTAADEDVLRAVGKHLGQLASRDLALRVRDGLEHDSAGWAARKRHLTSMSSSRWAGSITKATNDQWNLARRAQQEHAQSLAAAIRAVRRRLALPVGEPGRSGRSGGYRSPREWHAKSRRLTVLEARFAAVEEDRANGHVSVVRGGKELLRRRNNLAAAGSTEAQWRQSWEARRWFLSADGESGKRFGNETIRVTPDGSVSLRLPAPLTHLANAPHGRYELRGRIAFAHRGSEWRDRVAANRAIAYRIHYIPSSGRWYLDASWRQEDIAFALPAVLRAGGVIGIDLNADHLAAWWLDVHGNPVSRPRTFTYNLSGTTDHRDAQVRHALTRLLHWVAQTGARAIAVEDLDFTASKTREHHGGRRRFRRVVSGIPTSRLRSRLLAMAAAAGIAVIAVDPAYTSRWGAEHWRTPTSRPPHKTTRHEAAAIAIGRRALGHRIRRRAAPPRQLQMDAAGHRTAQAGPGSLGREGTRLPGPGSRTRSVPPAGASYAGDQATQHRSELPGERDSSAAQERFDSLFVQVSRKRPR